MGTTKGKFRNNVLTYYDGTTSETTFPVAPIYFIEDFLNNVIQTAGPAKLGWTVKDTGSATEDILANQHGGVAVLTLTSADEKQEAGLYRADALNWNLDKGPIIEIRAAVHTAPTSQSEIYFGLANAYVEGPIAEADAGPTVHAFFAFDGSLLCKIFTDDATTDNDAVTTATTVTLDQYYIFRIDFTDAADVKFYIDGTQVATSTTFDMSAGANVVTQPFLMCHKETGVGVGSLYVDYVKIWSPR